MHRTLPVGLVAACVLTLVAAACASSSGQHGAAATSAASPTLAQTDFAGLVDIGGGRQIWTTCRGQGSPTVVLLSGHGNGAEDWSLVLDPGDPDVMKRPPRDPKVPITNRPAIVRWVLYGAVLFLAGFVRRGRFNVYAPERLARPPR